MKKLLYFKPNLIEKEFDSYIKEHSKDFKVNDFKTRESDMTAEKASATIKQFSYSIEYYGNQDVFVVDTENNKDKLRGCPR